MLEAVVMGKNPNIIFRELSSKAENKRDKIESLKGTNQILEAGIKDKCNYVTYKEVVKSFLLEGYTESRAEKHIKQWLDYDLVTSRYIDGTRFLGFSDGGI